MLETDFDIHEPARQVSQSGCRIGVLSLFIINISGAG
jgi:hypothetical protein